MLKRISAVTAAAFVSLLLLIVTSLGFAQQSAPTSVRLAPVSVSLASSPGLPPEVQASEAGTLAAGFDRHGSTELVLYDEASVTLTFEAGTQVSALRVLGASGYSVSAEARTGNGNNASFAAIAAVQDVDLSTLADGWHTFPFGGFIQTTEVRLTFTPVAGGASSGVGEIELWGAGQAVRAGPNGGVLSALGNSDAIGAYRRYHGGGTISVDDRNPTDTMTVSIPFAPQDIRAAWITYELRGVHSWLAVRRSINSAAAEGGYVAAEENSWSTQIEAITPEQLVQGQNTITFGTLAGQERDYSLRNPALIIELEDGHGLVAGSGVLTDGDTGTGWSVVPDTPVTLPLGRHASVDALVLTLSGAPTGTISVDALDGEGTATPGIAGIALANDPSVTAAGNIYTIDLDGIEAESLVLTFQGVGSGAFTVAEADAIGSPLGEGRDPAALAVTWPADGEYYGRTGFLRGHALPGANASGTADIYVAGLPFGANDGAFEIAISKDQAGYIADADDTPWSVEVVALYPDGTSVTRNVLFDNPVFIEGLSTYTPGVLAETFLPGEERTVEHEEAELTVGTDALTTPTEIRISALSDIEVAKLDTGLINVTKGPRRGYRMLPHMRFNANVNLKLPFNRNRIPRGYTEADVQIFYFDEEAGRWMALENKSVDATAEEVAADTNHFTDFIAGVVVAPESPQVASFNPTQLKDMKVADPSAKINLIPSPQATNTGDATLSYPLELPPGRQGLAPQLSLNYSSGGGNGWVGLGWSMSTQEITIDTRWGVPRYSTGPGYDGMETETYLWNGQQLTPVAHRGPLVPIQAEREFHTRVEGGFNRIIRHGDDPANYWWEVTDKMGTRYAYGGDLDTGLQDPSAILADDNGNVFKWALTEVRDSNGNRVTYDHALVTDIGLAEGSVPGRQLYCTSIRYTGHGTTEGPFEVRLLRDRDLTGSADRLDKIIDGRGGFKMVTGDLLTRVEVLYNGLQVRAYEFAYEEGAFYKQLLTRVTQLDANDQPFNSHTFDYFDDTREADGSYKGFEPAVDWDQNGLDNVSLSGFFSSLEASGISGTEGSTIGWHFHGGFSPAGPSKRTSIGGKVGGNFANMTGRLQLIDLNGDGLTDKVFVNGGNVAWRRNISGPNGVEAYDDPRPVADLDDILKETATTVNGGVEIFFGISLGTNIAKTTTETTVFFTDVNGDGLPDMNVGGAVLFNVLNPGDVTPSFVPDSSGSAYPIGPGAVDAAALNFDFDVLLQDLIDSAPLADNLRTWEAPYAGTVQVTGDLALIEDTNPDRAEYITADGVRATIEVNGIQLYTTDIAATDYAPRTPALAPLSVAKGDVIYFRVQSNFDGAYDQVNWAPSVQYTSLTPATDANGLAVESYDAANDYTLFRDGAATVVATFNGTLQLDGTLLKTAQTTDDVTLEIVKVNDGVVTPIASQTIAWDMTGSFDLAALAGPQTVIRTEVTETQVGTDVNGDPIFETTVTQTGDQIDVRFVTDSPIDLGALTWAAGDPPRSYYTAISDPGQTLTNPDGSNATEIPLSPAISLYPDTNLAAPLAAWVAPVTGSVSLDPSVTITEPSLDTTLYVTVKSGGARIAKAPIPVVSGVATIPTVSFAATTGNEYFIEVSGSAPAILDDITVAASTITLPSSSTVSAPTGANGAGANEIVSQAYRGWRTYGYDGNRTRATQPVALTAADLALPTTADLSQREADLRAAVASGDPAQIEAALAALTPKVFPMAPDVELARWISGDEELWTEAGIQSSSRNGLNYPSVPDPSVYAGARAVSRISEGLNIGFSAGISFLSGAFSNTDTEAVLDFLDINGDRFPDIVSQGRSVQFSPMIGGLEPAVRTVTGMGGNVRETTATGRNFGIGGTFPLQVASGGGNHTVNGTGRRGGEPGMVMRSLGLNASFSDGTSDAVYDLRDMNADGLPDLITQVDAGSGNELHIRFNLGYRFSDPEPFSLADKSTQINDGITEGTSLGGGVNDGIYGWSFGINRSRTENYALQSIMDINGDGLMDHVREGATGGTVRVRLNSGRGFEEEIVWDTGSPRSGLADAPTIADGGGGYITIPICIPFTSFCFILNPGGDVGQTISRSEISIMDMDGDGFPEYLTSTDSDSLAVSLDTVERTNLLRSVNRPLGSTITLSYERSGNTTDQPQNKWVMNRIEVFDGFAGDGTDLLATNFAYENGFWDRQEREFYGYARVIEDHMNVDAPGGESVYRTVTRDFLNGTYYEKGLLAQSTTADAAGNLFLETVNTYDFVDIATAATVVDPESLTATVHPQLVRTDNLFYEGQPVAGKSTFMTYAYDQYGNVTDYFDAANLDTTDDDVASSISYHEDLPAYIVGKADQVIVTGLGREYRRREADFAPGTGNMTQLRSYLETGGIAVTDLGYDQYGNLITSTGPANATGQRYALDYVFDSEVFTYVTGITDSFGYTSSASYDVRFGELLNTTDLNNQPMDYVLDSVGRIVSVTGPYQQGTGYTTIDFEYNPLRDVPGDTQYPDVDVSWALTQHIDTYRDLFDPIETVLFIDGLGRVLQTKKDAAIWDGAAPQDRMVASGRITFDFLGRQTEQYYPVVEGLGSQGVFNAAYDTIAPTVTDYDVLDRPTAVTIPDGSTTTMVYDFGPDRNGTTQFRTLFTDAELNRRETYADVRKLMTSVKEINPAGGQPTIWTSYVYDPLRQITDVIDDQGNVTLAEYDNFGRMTVLNSPDMGRTVYGFDLASNLVTKQTANLAASGTAITYAYDFNRLSTVTYPEFTENNVTYTYGAPGAANNRANRIVTVTSEGGTEERFYGPLGEMVQQIRTVNSDTQGNSPNSPEVYTTLWTYDTWNRLQEMTYPDGEVLTNTYDSGGKLQQIDGAKTGFDYPYLRLLAYDKFGQRTFLRAGNNTETSYAYVPTTRRLDGLMAGNAQGRTFQDLSYSYDLVGNIVAQANAAGVTGANQLGGATSFTYQYDDLYRLTSSTGSWEYMPNKTEQYTLDMAYDTIHNIVSKDQQHVRVQPSGTQITQKKTSYDWTYTYGSAQPHAPSLIGDRAYSYDLNGNQTGWDHVQNGTRRTITWDEENRIQEVADNGHVKSYKYDDAGERVIKRGPQGETAYINQFFTMRNREVGTKHVFAGGTRLVSKLVKQPRDADGGGIEDPLPGCANPPWGWTNGNGNPGGNSGNCPGAGGNGGGNGGSNTEVFEKDQYYYHPDHLGSSSYVTDLDGEIFQHLEYFPFGETWVEEHSNTQRTPYLFTSKELDEETGLFYFGARYYDPRTSVWQSPDPILSEYLTREPFGEENSVFQPITLSIYAYGGLNPLKFIDPDGREKAANWQEAERKAMARLRAQGHTILNNRTRVTATRDGYWFGRRHDIVSMKGGVYYLTEVKWRENDDKKRSLVRKAGRALNPLRKLKGGKKIFQAGTALAQLYFDATLKTDIDLEGGKVPGGEQEGLSEMQGEVVIRWELWGDKKDEKIIDFSLLKRMGSQEERQRILDDLMEQLKVSD